MALIKKIYNNCNNNTLEKTMMLQAKILTELYSKKDSKNIQDYEFKVYSQNGEDGIIQFLINNINIKNKIFIEFGVENYSESNTKYLLLNNNWTGLILDGNKNLTNDIRKEEFGWKCDLKTISAFITKDNINDLISSSGISGEIGLLSLDIDGNDYWVFDAINCVNPQILIMEYNNIFGATAKVTIPYEEDFQRTKAHYSNLYWGASISALTDIANSKGYDLVGSNSFGNNIFFVRHDCNSLGINLTAKQAYVPSKYKESRDSNGNLTYLNPHKEGMELIKNKKVINIENNELIEIKDIINNFSV